MRIFLVRLMVVGACLAPFLAEASDQGDAGHSAWRTSLVIYLLAPTIDGRVGIGPTNSNVSVDPEAIFDAIDGGFLSGFTAKKGSGANRFKYDVAQYGPVAGFRFDF